MADTKLTALSAQAGAVVDADLFYGVDDPAGTPASVKVTALQIKTYTLLTPTLVGPVNVRDGNNAQTMLWHQSYTDGSNYSRARLDFTAGFARLHTGAAGTGVAQAWYFQAGGSGASILLNANGQIDFGAGASSLWRINTSGHLVAPNTNSNDIGASGAVPRDVYVGRNLILNPQASVTPANNGELMIEATSNTSITFKLKGSDGTVRSGSVTLS